MNCPDCPHMDASQMPTHWTPRAVCCVDRMPGHVAMYERLEAARAEASKLPTRQQRRQAERSIQKGKRL